MKFTSITLSKTKPTINKKHNFDAPLTLVYGKNGSGKTIIANALIQKFENNLNSKKTNFNEFSIKVETNTNIENINNFREISFLESFQNNDSNSINLETIKTEIMKKKEKEFNTHSILNHSNALKNKFTTQNQNLNQKLKNCQKESALLKIKLSRKSKLNQEKKLLLFELENLKEEQKKEKKKNENLLKTNILFHQFLQKKEKISEISTILNDEKKKKKEKKRILDELKNNYSLFFKTDFKIKNLNRLEKLFDEFKLKKFEEEKTSKAKSKANFVFITSLIFSNIALFSIFVFLYFFNFFSLTNNKTIAKIILTSAPILTLIYFTIFHKIKKNLNTKIFEMKIEEKVIEINKEIEKSDTKNITLSQDEIYPFLLQYFENFLTFLDKKSELDSLKEKSFNSKEISNSQEELSNLKDEIISITKTIERTTSNEINNLNFEKLESLHSDCKLQNEQINQTILKKDGILQKIEKELNKNNDISSLEKNLTKEIDSFQLKIKEIDENLISIKIILKTLFVAKKEIELKSINEFKNLILEIFQNLTSNIYDKRTILEYIDKIIIKDLNDNSLSVSIKQTIFLAIKFALSDFLIDENYTIPLILDEPFYFMDKERIDKLKSLIEETSKKRQVIIFTHNENFKNWGNYIEL